MRLILTRHGETVENKKGVLAGHMPGSLTEAGVRQAWMLAERLKDERIDSVYSSDLARAEETARIIMKFHEEVPLVLDRRLRETDYKGLTGKSKKLFDFHNWDPEVEQRDRMQCRVKELLEEAYIKHKDGRVLFVGHAGINRALISVVLGKPAGYMREINGIANTSLNVFEIDREKHEVHLLNCTSHLD